MTAKEGGEIAENSLRTGVDDVARGVEGAEGSSQKLLTWDGHSNEWMSGTEVTAKPAPANYEINMVVYKEQKNPGSFGTTDDISSLSYARNELAITPEYKQGNELYVQRYKVSEGTMIQEGTVGPQTYNGVTYKGTGNQTQILSDEGKKLMVPIGDRVKLGE